MTERVHTLGDGTFKVHRVVDDHGSHIEPPLDPDWSPLAKLQWHAAVAEHDGGLDIHLRVKDGTGYSQYKPRRSPHWVTELDVYSITHENAGHSPMSFQAAWTWLNGLASGLAAARHATQRRESRRV